MAFDEMSDLSERLARFGKNWSWVLLTGIAYVILGIIAFSWPVGSTLGLTFAMGVLFVVGGLIQLFHFAQFRKQVGNAWRIFQSVTALAAGLLILRFPEGGMLGIAIALAIYFFANATMKWVVAAGMRPHKGWGWVLLSAVASFLLGAYLIATFPVSAVWVPGLLLGVDFAILGVSLIGFSFDLRQARKLFQERNVETDSESRRAG